MPTPSPPDLLASLNQLVLSLQRTYLPRAALCTTPPSSRLRRRLEHLSRLVIRLQRLTTRDRQDASDWVWFQTLLQLVDQDFLDGLSRRIGSSSGNEADDDGDDQSGSLPKRFEGTTLAMRSKLRQVIQEIQEYLQSSSASTRKRRRPRDSFIPSDPELEHPATGTTPDCLTLREKLDQAYALHLAVHDPIKLEQHRRIGPLPPAPADAEGSQEEEGTVPSLSTAPQILSRLSPHWTETALSSLRSSDPEVTLDELKSLLWKYADPLIPSRLGHGNLKPLLRETFLSPTPRPVSYAAFKTKILHPLFELLGRLCSPARDEQARTLMERLDKSKEVEHVVALTLDALVLIDQMHLDLRFARKLAKRHLGSEQLDRFGIEKKAIESERRMVWQILRNNEWGTVQDETARWIRERGGAEVGSTMENGFRKAFLESVFDTKAVQCVDIDSPSSTSTTTEEGSAHRLPLTLLVPAPRIFTLQNHLQALVIVACLNSIVSSNVASGSTSQERSMMTRRLWMLLRGIVDSDSELNGKGEGETKLINLVDEMMQLHRGIPAGERMTKKEKMEEGLKRRVESVLRYEDPVFKLFSRRLKEGVERELERTSSARLVEDRNVPRELKTGRQVLSFSSASSSSPSTPKPEAGFVSIKGFEDLQEPLGQVLVQLQAILDWVQKVWGEEIGWTRSQVSQV